MDTRKDMKLNICNSCYIFKNGAARTAFYIAVDPAGFSALWGVHYSDGEIKSVQRYLEENENDLYLDMLDLGYSVESVRKFYNAYAKFAFKLNSFAAANSFGCREDYVCDEPVLMLSNGMLHADNLNKTEKIKEEKGSIWDD